MWRVSGRDEYQPFQTEFLRSEFSQNKMSDMRGIKRSAQQANPSICH
jgi:hypothetical protein